MAFQEIAKEVGPDLINAANRTASLIAFVLVCAPTRILSLPPFLTPSSPPPSPSPSHCCPIAFTLSLFPHSLPPSILPLSFLSRLFPSSTFIPQMHTHPQLEVKCFSQQEQMETLQDQLDSERDVAGRRTAELEKELGIQIDKVRSLEHEVTSDSHVTTLYSLLPVHCSFFLC